MIEVFKTNVSTSDQADMLAKMIHSVFESYQVNFDLEDCDNILRVNSTCASIDSDALINLLKRLGFQANVLSDEVPSKKSDKIAISSEKQGESPFFQVGNLS